jgi:hypothetical protein
VLELIKPISITVLGICGCIYLIRLVRAAQHNHKLMQTLSDEDRKELGEHLRTTPNQPLEVGGAFTVIPWWALLIVFIFFAAAIATAVIYVSGN